MTKKILVIEDWEELMSYLTQIAKNSDDRYAVYDAVEDRLVKAQLPGVIEFEAEVDPRRLSRGMLAKPYRIEIPEDIDLELDTEYQVFVVKKEDK